jgi:outer membrane protein assembly factor BamB
MDTGPVRCTRFVVSGLCLVLAGCTAGSSTPATSPTPGGSTTGSPATTPSARPSGAHPAAVWPAYHGGNARSGFTQGPVLRPPLRKAWTRPLDGVVYAQPIVVGSTVIAATENNTVYALRADTGAVVWRRHLGRPVPRSQLPCGNIDPLGITGTPAYDAVTGDVFVVTETTGGSHDLHAIDARNGRVEWSRNLDVVDRDRRAEQERGALLVAHRRVYVAFGGLFGDCGNYIGYVTGVATGGKGQVLRYEVPSGREAGIWAAAGPVEDPLTGDLLVAVGNGSETGDRFDGSDSVLRLSPTLQQRALFAPSTWAQDNAADLDLGSMSPVLAQHHVVIAGKRGTVYLLPPNLGGIGGELDTLGGCAGFGGAAVVAQVVVLPCSDGIRRLGVTGDHLRWDWRLPDVGGSPLIVGGTVYTLSRDTGDLYAVDLRTGRVRARVHVDTVTRFATPAPAGRFLVVGTTNGVVAVSGK